MKKKQDKIQLYRDELAVISSGECFTDSVRVVTGAKSFREVIRMGFYSDSSYSLYSLYDRHAGRLLDEILADFLV